MSWLRAALPWAMAAWLLGVATGSAVARAQTRLSDAQIEQQMTRLGSGSAQQRARAADALGRGAEHRRDRVVPTLRRCLREDDDWRVRASSGRALGRLGARAAVPDLVRALRDDRVDVRVVAAAALWRLPDPAAVPALLELLRDEDASARQWGVLALGVIRDRRATRPLLRLLQDAEHDVRLDTIRSLGRLRDPAALRALEAFVRDGDRDREERIEAISSISLVDGPQKVNVLVRLARFEGDAFVRERAVQALGRVGDALVLPALRERREVESSRSVRASIDEAIEAVQRRRAGGEAQGGGAPLNLPPM